jgi:signal peptidase II
LTEARPQRAPGRPHWAIFLGLAATIVVLDQATKAWILANLSPGEAIEIVGDWVRLVLTRNAGALFGMFQDNALLFGLVSTVVIGAIVVFHGRSTPSRATSIALGLLLGGALGNLIDRFRLGYVVDFVDIGLGDVFRWYTFNVADAAISAAIVSLIVLAVWPGVGEWIDRLGTPLAEPTEPAEAAESTGAAGRPVDG